MLPVPPSIYVKPLCEHVNLEKKLGQGIVRFALRLRFTLKVKFKLEQRV